MSSLINLSFSKIGYPVPSSVFLPFQSSSTSHFKIYCQKTETKSLPPGPGKLPLIGNLHNMVGSLPHQTLRDLATEYGPLMHLQLGEHPAIVVSSAKMAQEVLKTHDHLFLQRVELLAGKILSYGCTNVAFSKGEYWKQVRRICMTELLSAKKVRSFAALREDEVSKVVESIRLAGETPVNFSQMIFWMTSVIVCRASLGNRTPEDQKDIITITKEAVELSAGFDLTELYPSLVFLQLFSSTKHRLQKLKDKMDKLYDAIIKERKEQLVINGGDIAEDEILIDVLLRLQQNGNLERPITADNIKAVIVDMFVAGTDTSSTTTEWAMSEMVKNPRVLKKAQAEIRQLVERKKKKTISEEDIQELHYLHLIIKETLRLHPPVSLLLPRESSARCEIEGYEIPEKTRLIVNTWAIGRDPNCWEDPESFIPERFIDNSVDFIGSEFKFVPFGGGRRVCPGILFGVANVELPLAKLLYHFDWKLPDGVTPENLDMTEAFGSAVARKNSLHLIATPYKT